MMKKICEQDREPGRAAGGAAVLLPPREAGGHRRGAALVVALSAVVVVMLSVMLLLGYISSMTHRQNDTEELAQARLSQASAVEGLTRMARRGEIDPSGELPDFEIAGMITSFSVVESWQSGLHEHLIPLPDGARNAAVAVSGGVLLVAWNDASGNLFVESYDPVDWSLDGRVSIPLEGSPDWSLLGVNESAAGAGILAAIVLESSADQDRVVLLDTYGHSVAFDGDIPNMTDSSILQMAMLNGVAVLLVSDGLNGGAMVPLYSWEIQRLSAPEATCPVITSGGDLLAGSGSEIASLGAPGVEGWIETDVDGDGRPDIVWFGSQSLAAYSQGRGQLFVDGPQGMRLVAWGSFEGSGGLAGLWVDPSGGACWRRLGWNGFQPLPGDPVPGEGWSGRIHGAQGLFTGVCSGSIVLRNVSGSVDTTIAGASGSVILDLNGDRGIDVVEVSSAGVRIVSNVIGSAGMSMTVEAVTIGNTVVVSECYIIEAPAPGPSSSHGGIR